MIGAYRGYIFGNWPFHPKVAKIQEAVAAMDELVEKAKSRRGLVCGAWGRSC